jgi:predicted phosphoribosyltransferase
MSVDGVEVDEMISALARAHETHRVVVAGPIASDLACATCVRIDGVACVTLGRTLFDQLAHGAHNLPK